MKFDLKAFKKYLGRAWVVLETSDEFALVFNAKEHEYGIFNIFIDGEANIVYDGIYYIHDLDSVYEEWKAVR